MDLNFTPEENAFREEVRAFIREALPASTRRKMELGQSLERDEVVSWQRQLNARGGWAVPSWPKEAGGPGWTPVQRYIFMDELHQAPAPEPLSFNAAMIGPVLITFGSEGQKKRFLPATANADIWWCQGFSEPDAGSDLANLRTAARREGDHYVVNGQKMWQGMGHRADWMFLLVRTDPSAPKKQAGISMFLVDMKTPGITVRPIITIDGRHEVNEVFLDDVRVPVENRIGEENQGWTYAKFLLSNERTNVARIGMTKRILARIRSLADDPATGLSGEARKDLLGEAWGIEAELKALEITQLRILAAMKVGEADPRSSILKLKGVDLRQAASELLLRVAGPLAYEFAYENEPVAPFEVASNYFTLRAASIYGGASEVQKNIIASAIMGL